MCRRSHCFLRPHRCPTISARALTSVLPAPQSLGLSQHFLLCPWGVARAIKGLAIATVVTARFLSETSSSATSYNSEFSKRLLSTYICESPTPTQGRTHPGSLPISVLSVSSWSLSWPVLVQGFEKSLRGLVVRTTRNSCLELVSRPWRSGVTGYLTSL